MQSLGLPLRLRNMEDIAITVPKHSCFTVGAIITLAIKIRDNIQKIWPTGKQLAPGILVSSRDPVLFVSGILGCHMAQATAICWSENTFTAEELSNLVSAVGVLTKSNKNKDDFKLEKISSFSWLKTHPGNIVVVTSGSTGQPKGVSLTLESIVLNAFLAGEGLGLEAYQGWSIEVDLALMSAISHFFMAWQYNLPFYWLKDSDQKEKDAVFSKQSLGFGGAPLQLKRYAEERFENAHPSCMVSSGDFLSASIINQVQERFPDCPLHSFYGLTEVSGRFCRLSARDILDHSEISASGYPLPGFAVKTAIASKNNDGQGGELLLKTPLLFKGYYRQNQKFETVSSGDWFATGDLATIHDKKLVSLKGRIGDVFKVSGEKVDRITIERCLEFLLKPHDYCVLPVDHSFVGKVPALFVAKNISARMPEWKEIMTYLRGKLPSRFIPVYLYILDDLPYLANGKIDKVCLIQNHESYERIS